MKTFIAKRAIVNHDWYLVDATNQVLGRLASKVAYFLRGKHKPEYTPHIDVGDFIIVINADKILVTGDKYRKKIYYHHTGYIGGIKQTTFEKMLINCPMKIIELAVKGMLPKGPLGRSIINKLKIYKNNNHIHTSQKPKNLII